MAGTGFGGGSKIRAGLRAPAPAMEPLPPDSPCQLGLALGYQGRTQERGQRGTDARRRRQRGSSPLTRGGHRRARYGSIFGQDRMGRRGGGRGGSPGLSGSGSALGRGRRGRPVSSSSGGRRSVASVTSCSHRTAPPAPSGARRPCPHACAVQFVLQRGDCPRVSPAGTRSGPPPPPPRPPTRWHPRVPVRGPDAPPYPLAPPAPPSPTPTPARPQRPLPNPPPPPAPTRPPPPPPPPTTPPTTPPPQPPAPPAPSAEPPRHAPAPHRTPPPGLSLPRSQGVVMCGQSSEEVR